MSRIFIHGLGAVSPAGWGLAPLRDALANGAPLPTQPLPRPVHPVPLTVRRVPAPSPRPAFLGHPRLRRTSLITHFAAAAALEALGAEGSSLGDARPRLGIIFCAFGGCVGYSRRFYDEALRDPATASPLVFPETVFNAPASHLSALLGSTAMNYTLVGDQGEAVKALALAADWLLADRVDGCLVVASEEADWLTAGAQRLFDRDVPLAEGAGAIYLRREPSPVELGAVTDPQLFLRIRGRAEAALWIGAALGGMESDDDLLVDGLTSTASDAAELAAWTDGPKRRLSPKRVLGDGLAAASAWQLVMAADAIQRSTTRRAVVSVVGSNEQAVGAVLRRA